MKMYKYEKTQGLQKMILFIVESFAYVNVSVFSTLNFHPAV